MPISEEEYFNGMLQRDGTTQRFDVAVSEGPLESKVSVKMGWQRWTRHWPCSFPWYYILGCLHLRVRKRCYLRYTISCHFSGTRAAAAADTPAMLTEPEYRYDRCPAAHGTLVNTFALLGANHGNLILPVLNTWMRLVFIPVSVAAREIFKAVYNSCFHSFHTILAVTGT
jgi:hypothetical protein